MISFNFIRSCFVKQAFGYSEKITFCTTYRNREEIFKNVFFKNQEIIKKHPEIDWFILDYNSPDNFIKNIGIQCSENNIHFYKELSSNDFHMARAKNMVGKLVKKGFLINLDCDVFLSEEVILFLKEQISKGFVIGRADRLGLYGFLISPVYMFQKEQGYDERFVSYSGEDTNFFNKCFQSNKDYYQIVFEIPARLLHHQDHSDTKRLSWGDITMIYDRNRNNTFGEGVVQNLKTGDKILL